MNDDKIIKNTVVWW